MKFSNFIYKFFFEGNFFPILTIITVIGIFWYLIALPMNAEKVERKFKDLNTEIKIGINHNLYKHNTIISKDTQNALIKDFI